jgi:spore maturation protein B
MLVVPLLVLFCLIVSLIKKKNPYDSYIEGVKESFPLIKELLPSLMSMVVAVNVLRVSGVIEDLSLLLNKYFLKANYFIELLPMVVFRPISGSASISVINNICTTHGPDSLLCRTVSAIQGSTDTTFYVIALYFSSIKVTKWRHTLKAALFADFVGITLALIFAFVIFG